MAGKNIIYVLILACLLFGVVAAADFKNVVVIDAAGICVNDTPAGIVLQEAILKEKGGVIEQPKEALAGKMALVTTSEDAVDIKTKYIADNIDLVGSNRVVIGNNTVDIEIISQRYDAEHALTVFNLTATVNGRSKLIHNPFKIYNPPTEVTTGTAIRYDEKLKKCVTFLLGRESPQNALVSVLGRLVLNMPYGNPTFDGIDPTLTVYTSNSTGFGLTMCATWASARNSASSITLDTYQAEQSLLILVNYSGYGLNRAAEQFNTSALGSLATVTNASLYLQNGTYYEYLGDVPYDPAYSDWSESFTATSFYPTTGMNNSVVSDYSRFGNEVLTNNYSASGIIDPPYTPREFVFKSGCLTYIKKTANTYIMMRELHDVDNRTPPSYASYYIDARVFGVAAANTTARPYIIITYAINPFAANFTGNPTTINGTETVTFTDTSNGATGWNWSFGDGMLNTTQYPLHVYGKYGIYSVTLNATNGTAYNTTIKTNYITVKGNLTANFTSDVVTANISQLVQFTDTSVNGTITGWNWSFGDGALSTTANPTHTYWNERYYNVTLNVTSPTLTNQTTKTNYILIVFPIIANFNYTVVSSNSTHADLIFNGTYMGATPTNWSWTFGDAATMYYGQNQMHTYNASGVFTVVLNASNANTSSTNSQQVYTLGLVGDQAYPQVLTAVHNVRFICRDWAGVPIANMHAVAVGVETTMGAYDWIPSLFGINLGVTNVVTTSQTGNTGNDGAIVFVMIPEVKYQITYTCTTRSISEDRYYYPKEEVYQEIFWTEAQRESSYDHLEYHLYNHTNGTYMDLGIMYTDTHWNATTNSLTFFVQNQSHATIYTTTVVPSNETTNLSYPISTATNGVYYWGFSANSTREPLPINVTANFRVSGNLLVDVGIGTNAGSMEIYNWMAIILIFIFGFVFSRANIKFGLVIVPIMAMFFKFIGWLSTNWLLLALAMTLGVFLYMRYSEEESGV